MLQLNSEERAEPMVRALSDAYRNSQHGRTGSSRREFNIRYDKLVHELAHATVTEEKRGRVILERMRLSGLIRWNHTPLQRDQIKTIYIAPASEKDLFIAIGETPPSVERTNAVGILAKHLNALNGHPDEGAWKAALQQAIDDTNSGRSAEGLPNDAGLHDEILSATAAVLNNQQPILIRRLSAEKLRNSKLLQRRRETVERFMAQFLPPDIATLEAWKVADTPPVVLLRGPLGIELDNGTLIDELPPDSAYTIKEEILARVKRIFTSSKRCLSIENHTTFRETVAVNSKDLIVHTSYPSSSVVKLLQLLPTTMHLQHWGDTDPWGYDILRVLREKTGRTIQPWRMSYRPRAGLPLSKRESAILFRLIADPLVADVRSELTAMQTAGSKGNFEQESLPAIEPQYEHELNS
jgi:Uncharacterized protein conserved in bacteria C-term(DUF2220)